MFIFLIFDTRKLVCVAIPLILDNRFKAVLSHDKTVLALPDTSKTTWFGFNLVPSFFIILPRQPFRWNISLANLTPAKIPSSLEIILALIFFFGNNTLVISPLCISSEINRNNSFLILVYN